MLVFIFCSWSLPPDSRLFAPSSLATIDPTTGQLKRLRTLESQDLLAGQVPGQTIGSSAFPKHFIVGLGLTQGEWSASREAFDKAEAQLYRDYDVVLPFFATGTLRVPAQVPPAARELQQLFSLIAEPPLAPYYQDIGKEFFAWLAAVAK